MKKLTLLLTLAAASFGFTSCCSLFGLPKQNGHYRTETRQVKTCQYDVITEEVATPGDSKSGKAGMCQTIERKVPRYKTVTKQVWVSNCTPCVRHYCPETDPCGTTSESTIHLSSAQGSVGSPHIGLMPTMRPIAP